MDATITNPILGKCITCKSDASKFCTNCKNVQYCSVDCQKSDWKSHKPNCWPIRIVIEGKTKHLVTTREVQEKELIWSEVPLLIVPSSQITESEKQLIGIPPSIICLACNKFLTYADEEGQRHKKNLYVCSKCQWPVCNASCERDPRHSGRECKILQIWEFSDRTRPKYNQYVGIIRILLLKSTNPTKWKQILELKSKYSVDLHDHDQYNIQIEVCQLIKNILSQLSIELTNEECFMATNLTLTWASDPLIGGNEFQKELYYKSSFITHDCLPNTIKLIQQSKSQGKDQKLKFYAKTKLLPGTKLTQVWRFESNHAIGTWDRRNLVSMTGRGGLWVWCNCALCSDPTEFGSYISALKCPNHSRATTVNAYLLPINPLDQKSEWKCNTCTETFPNETILQILHPIQTQINSLIVQAKRQQYESIDFERAAEFKDVDKSLLQKMIQYDKELNAMVHPNHYFKICLRQQILSGLNHLICPISPSVPLPAGVAGGGNNVSMGLIIFWRDNQRENMEKMHKMVLEVLPVLETIVPDTFAHYRAMYFLAISRWTHVALALENKSFDSSTRQILSEAEALSEKLDKKIIGFKDFKFDELPMPHQVIHKNLGKLKIIKDAFNQGSLRIR